MRASNSVNSNSGNHKHQPIFLDNEPFKVHERFQKEKHCVDACRYLDFGLVIRLSAISWRRRFYLPARKRDVFCVFWFEFAIRSSFHPFSDRIARCGYHCLLCESEAPNQSKQTNEVAVVGNFHRVGRNRFGEDALFCCCYGIAVLVSDASVLYASGWRDRDAKASFLNGYIRSIPDLRAKTCYLFLHEEAISRGIYCSAEQASSRSPQKKAKESCWQYLG